MAATKYSIAEQVMLRLKGGRPDMANRVDIRDIILSVGQVASELLKAQYYKETLPTGETIPDGCMIATYEGVAVSTWKTVSRSILPAMPISLPRGMGVFMITDPNNPHCVFVPALPGQIAMVKSQQMISSLGGLYAYEQYGGYVEYSENLVADSVNTVMMRLIVPSIDSLSDYDMLPMPADFEGQIIEEVFSRFTKTGESDKDGDVMTENFSKQ